MRICLIYIEILFVQTYKVPGTKCISNMFTVKYELCVDYMVVRSNYDLFWKKNWQITRHR
jgi:hypothetical protein